MINLGPLYEIFTSLPGTLAFCIIFLMSFLFTSQIFAWITPPNPKFLHALAIGTVAGAIITWVIYTTAPLTPALISASITGVYSNWGYLWIISLLFLILVFLVNTMVSWKENKPLEMIR